MADTKKLKKTVGKSAVRNTIQISAGDRIYYAIVDVLLGVFTIIVLSRPSVRARYAASAAPAL